MTRLSCYTMARVGWQVQPGQLPSRGRRRMGELEGARINMRTTLLRHLTPRWERQRGEYDVPKVARHEAVQPSQENADRYSAARPMNGLPRSSRQAKARDVQSEFRQSFESSRPTFLCEADKRRHQANVSRPSPRQSMIRARFYSARVCPDRATDRP
jgi:hypothetical protein